MIWIPSKLEKKPKKLGVVLMIASLSGFMANSDGFFNNLAKSITKFNPSALQAAPVLHNLQHSKKLKN